jgi:hypothetical protein
VTQIYLVRHGRTPWNEQGLLQGWADVSLAQVGRREASRVGAAITSIHEPERVVTSPLARAIETAEIVADRTGVASVETDPGWKERSFGSLEGELSPPPSPGSDSVEQPASNAVPILAPNARKCRRWKDRSFSESFGGFSRGGV